MTIQKNPTFKTYFVNLQQTEHFNTYRTHQYFAVTFKMPIKSHVNTILTMSMLLSADVSNQIKCTVRHLSTYINSKRPKKKYKYNLHKYYLTL